MQIENLKVLHLVTGLNVGGAEKAILDLCIVQRKAGMTPVVVSITSNDRLKPLFNNWGIEPIFLAAGRNAFSLIKNMVRLNKLVRKKGINVLHCHLFHPLIFAYVLKFLNPRLKIVFTSHSFNIGSRFRELITRVTKGYRDADVIFSESMKTGIYKKYATTIIPNGIDFSNYTESKEKSGKFTFICVARLEKVKNHLALLEAASQIKGKHEFELWLVGDGAQKDVAMNAAKRHGIDGRVKFLGYRSDIPALLAQSHCFILPSLWEGLPISILEACAAKMPVISTAVGSIPDFFSTEDILFTETTAESISKGMSEMIIHYDKYLNSAHTLYGKARIKFDLDLVGEKYMQLYQSLLT